MIRSILLIGTSVTASYFDIKTRKIPNWLCFSSIAIGLFLSRSFTSFVWHMFTLLFLFALSAFRLMGHGDMKLWMAISTYVNFEGTMYIMIIAAVMMIIYAICTSTKSSFNVIKTFYYDFIYNKRICFFDQKDYPFASFLLFACITYVFWKRGCL